MYKRIIFTIIVISLYIFICNKIYYTTNKKHIDIDKKSFISHILPIKKEQPIGKLIINKINLNRNIYSINSKLNNVDKNVTILKDSIEPQYKNSILFIAAHSGNDTISYFNDLDRLKIGDEIILIYKNKQYTYSINRIWEDPKNGYININKENKKQLVLTTCSKKHLKKQLIINSTIKES